MADPVHSRQLTYLSQINSHPRDAYINFRESDHVYTICLNNTVATKPTSVTTLIHHYFPKFEPEKVVDKMMANREFPQAERYAKYRGMTREQILTMWSSNEAADLGTAMHAQIEEYLNCYAQSLREPEAVNIYQALDTPEMNQYLLAVNSGVDSEIDISVHQSQMQLIEQYTPEFRLFLRFWADFRQQNPNVELYRTEWIIYDENRNIAGSIDCVLRTPEGKLIILDWKRSKEIKTENKWECGSAPFQKFPHCNFYHYTLQLNMYRHILEKRYDQEVIFMMLVILHPNQSSPLYFTVDRVELSGVWDSLSAH